MQGTSGKSLILQHRCSDDTDAMPRTTRSRTQKEKRKVDIDAAAVIDLLHSSDEEEDVSVRNTSQSSSTTSTTMELSAIRVAFGKKVESQECKVVFSRSLSKPMLTISYEPPTRRRRKSNRGAIGHFDIDVDDILEARYFLDANNNDDRLLDNNEMTNFLALRVLKSETNGLERFSNAYDPLSDQESGRRYLVIEFRCDNQFQDLLAAMRAIDVWAAFLNSSSDLNPQTKSSYCKSLESDSQKKLRQDTSNFTKSKAEKGCNALMLEYPFAGDANAMDRAAEGLKELSDRLHAGVAEDKDYNDYNNIKTVVDDASGGAILTINVQDYERLDAPEYWNDTLIDFFLLWCVCLLNLIGSDCVPFVAVYSFVGC